MLIDVTRSVNRTLSGKHPTGIDRVCLAYLAHYSDISRGLLWVAGRPCLWSICHTRWLGTALAKNISRPWLILNLAVRLAMDVLLKPKRDEMLLHLGHSGLEKPELGKLIEKYQLRLVCMVHDLIPLTHPHFSRAGTPEKHALRMKHVLAWSSGILANSHSTLNALALFAAENQLSLPPSVVTHLPAATLPEPSTVRPLSEPYFVMLGTIEGRKNHLLMLDVWRRLINAYGEETPRLLIIGQRGWACGPVLDALDHDRVLKQHMIELNDCDDAQLSNWLHHARALLFPSHVEGYGIPMVEALGLGVPVIASDLEVFHEIAGDIPDYLSTNDLPGWESTIVDYLGEDSQARNSQLQRMQSFQAPSWESHFNKAETLINTHH